MPGVQDKVVIVTGGGGGLGRAYAGFLADNGALVVVIDLGGAKVDYSSVATTEGAEAIVATALLHSPGGPRQTRSRARRARGRLPAFQENHDTGSVFVVGGGLIQRVAQLQNDGVTFGRLPSLEEMACPWPQVSDISDANPGTSPV